MELIIDGIDVFNPLRGKEEDVKKAFITVYGKHHKDKIDKNFANMCTCFLPLKKFGKITPKINEFYLDKRCELEKDFYVELTGCSDFRAQSVAINYKPIELVDLDISGSTKKDADLSDKLNVILQFLGVLKTREQVIIEKITQIGCEDESELAKQIRRNARAERFTDSELDKFLAIPKNRKKVQEFIDKLSALYKQKHIIVLEKLAKEQELTISKVSKMEKDLLDLSEKRNKELQDFCSLSLKRNKKLNKPFRSKQQKEELVSAYSSLMQLKSTNADLGNISPYGQERYIKFFNSLGFHYGKDIKKYENDPKINELLFSEETLMQYKKIQNKYALMQAKRYEPFADAVEKVSNLKPEEGNKSLISNLYSYESRYASGLGAYVLSQVDKKTGNLVGVVACPWAVELQHDTVIHELGHVAEHTICYQDENTTRIKSGFDIIEFDHEEKSFDWNDIESNFKDESFNTLEKRDFELLSETFHELIIEDVMDELNKSNLKLSIAEQTGKCRSSYTDCFLLIEEIYINHKQKILDARMSNDEKALENLFGEKVANQLASEVYEYWKKSRTAMADKACFEDELDEARVLYGVNSLEQILSCPQKWSESSKPFLEHLKKVYYLQQKIDEKMAQNQS